VSAPNFTDEDNPTIFYNNPAGDGVSKIEVAIYKEDGSQSLAPYREVSKTSTSYTFLLTNAERENLWKYTPNSNTATVKFYIKTITKDGRNELHSIAKTLTIINSYPYIQGITITDTNTNIVNATQDSKCIIKGVSTMRVFADIEPTKGATISYCHITNGSNTYKSNTGLFDKPTSSVITCIIEDSRGNITKEVIDLANNDIGNTWVNYTAKPTCNASASASLALNSQTKAYIQTEGSGTFYNGKIGDKTNTLTLKYKITKNGEADTTIEIGTITPSVSGNKYTFTDKSTALVDYDGTYDVVVYVKDLISDYVYTDVITVSTLPVFDWGKEDFNFNVPVSFNGATMNDFVVEYGTEAMGSNGTWYWQKWNSGKAECYGLRNYGNMGVSTAFGGLYRSEAFQQSLPSGLFKSVPECCNINYAGSSSDWAAFIMPRLPADANNSCGFYVVRPGSATITQAKISFHILGRWK
jgi:hypothetical protein